jgi:hypothetical protein
MFTIIALLVSIIALLVSGYVIYCTDFDPAFGALPLLTVALCWWLASVQMLPGIAPDDQPATKTGRLWAELFDNEAG